MSQLNRFSEGPRNASYPMQTIPVGDPTNFNQQQPPPPGIVYNVVAPPGPGFVVGPSVTRVSTSPYNQNPMPGPVFSTVGTSYFPQSNMNNVEGNFEQPQGTFLYVAGKEIRSAFIQKVYLLLTFELGITFGLVFALSQIDGVKQFAMNNGILIIFLALLGMVPIFVLVCNQHLQRTYPANMLLLTSFSVIMGINLTLLCSLLKSQVVYLAFGVTLALFIFLTICAWLSCIDFTPATSIMLVVTFVLLLFGIIYAFFPKSQTMELVYCIFGVLVYSIWVVIDTQLIMGDKQLALTEEDYILGVLKLYLDFINIFLFILRLMSGDRS